MKIISKPLDWYIKKLKKYEFFSFTRWGDGEWACLFGEEGQNCDGHKYFPEMAKDLQEAITNPKGHYLATWPMDGNMFKNNGLGKKIEEYVNHDDPWYDARVWEGAAMAGELKPLTDQLNRMSFVMVSEESKIALPFVNHIIKVPSTDCYLHKNRIIDDIMAVMPRVTHPPVFGFSASMATNAIVDHLYPLIGHACWLIDFGSIWEPYLGVLNRSYHHRYKTTEL